MTRLPLLAALALSACAGKPLDLCKGAELRRLAYTSAISAADTYAALGRVVPYELAIGRQAAVIALASLDARCPVVGRQGERRNQTARLAVVGGHPD